MPKPIYASRKFVESALPSEGTSEKSATANPLEKQKAVLVLEDGSVFSGCGFGASNKVSAEVVFSTSMIGYPEALTDPSYNGQILALTYPLVGNYGVPPDDLEFGIPKYFESKNIQAAGLVIHELCTKPSHWLATKTLDEWLIEENIPGIYGIDTRRLTKKLRAGGVMLGILQTYREGHDPDVDKLIKEVDAAKDPNLTDLVRKVTVKEPLHYEVGARDNVVLIDCGVKNSILRNILNFGINIVQVPYDFSAKEILEYKPKGVVLSNGPGDPKKCAKTVECVRELVEEEIPTMGICLGNQILALAFGGDTYKLKYGHRSQNQPVLDLASDRCYITTQNHGYAVSQDSLDKGTLDPWFLNANDQTVEGIRHKRKPAFAVQWHPEGAPGPYDTKFLFDEFIKLMR